MIRKLESVGSHPERAPAHVSLHPVDIAEALG
jgi:hypothetical protein